MKLILLFLACLCAAASAAEKPNIVFILADDLGYGDASCYGATRLRTPHLDRLAREGMRFTDAHTPSSVCSPTRYNLLTGRYAWRTWAGSIGIWSNDPLVIETQRTTLASLLQTAGYRTGIVGKWHLGFGARGQPGWDELLGPDYNRDLVPGPLEVGFDSYFGFPHTAQHPHLYIRDRRVVGLEKLAAPIRLVLDPRPVYHQTYDVRPRHIPAPAHTFENTDPIRYEHEDLALRITDEAVQWIGQQTADKPFFLYFAHRNPHSPHRPHPRFQGTSDAGVYGDFVHEFDWSVGQVLAALDRGKLAANTLVIVSSDNGAVGTLKDHRVTINGHHANGAWRGQKTELYEGGHRVPLLVRWPGTVRAASECDALVAHTDWLATCAELLGVTLPRDAGEDSFSFLPVLTGRPPTRPVRTALVHDSNLGKFAIRRGDWKLITIQGGGGIGWQPGQRHPDQPPGQLYDLRTDPAETRNVHAQHPDIVAELQQLLDHARTTSRTAP